MSERSFDCLRMKSEIQERLLDELQGLTPREQRRWIDQRLSASPVFGPMWARLKRETAQQGSSPATSGGSPAV